MKRLLATIDRIPPYQAGVRYYIIAALLALLAVAMTLVLREWTGLARPYVMGLAAVMVAASIGGAGPALVTGGVLLVLWRLVLPDLPDTNIWSVAVVGLLTLVLGAAGEAILWARRRDTLIAWRMTQRELSLQSIFESLPAAMIVIDKEGEILAANDKAMDLLAVDAAQEELMIQSFLDIPEIPEEPDLLFADRLLRFAAGPDLVPGHRRGGRDAVQLTIAAAPLRTSGRDLITLYLRDETPVRRAAEATAEVQANVAQLGRAAALGAMGSAIAHELNQPLASAANFAGAALTHLSRHPGTPPLAIAAIESTVRQVVRASEILKGLRKFVRAAPITPQWLDIERVVREAVQLGHFVLNDMRVSLEVEIDESARFVWMDRVQIQQVLVNLLNNAAEAVGTGEERIVRIHVRLLAADLLELCISDTGPGVSAEVHQRLFEPFNTSKGQGLGVGLSISKTIIEAHGGAIWYDGSSEGARFCLTLKHSDRREDSDGEWKDSNLHH